VDSVTDRLEGVALRLGGRTIRLEREEDRQDRAASEVQLLLQGKALEGVEDVAAAALEVVGKGDSMKAPPAVRSQRLRAERPR
jgi:hypothetical protein